MLRIGHHSNATNNNINFERIELVHLQSKNHRTASWPPEALETVKQNVVVTKIYFIQGVQKAFERFLSAKKKL